MKGSQGLTRIGISSLVSTIATLVGEYLLTTYP